MSEVNLQGDTTGGWGGGGVCTEVLYLHAHLPKSTRVLGSWGEGRRAASCPASPAGARPTWQLHSEHPASIASKAWVKLTLNPTTTLKVELGNRQQRPHDQRTLSSFWQRNDVKGEDYSIISRHIKNRDTRPAYPCCTSLDMGGIREQCEGTDDVRIFGAGRTFGHTCGLKTRGLGVSL